MNGLLVKAARGFLGWSRLDLAREMGVSQETVINLETGTYSPATKTREALELVLRLKGIAFFEVHGILGIVFSPHPVPKANELPSIQNETVFPPTNNFRTDEG